MTTVVLGAGLAGLSAAYTLARAGRDVVVFEKEDYVGGMASSWQVGPFWLDHGPHRFHSRDRGLIEHLYEVLDHDVVLRERRSRILLGDKFFDYPLRTTNVLKGLPKSTLVKALRDYVWIRMRQRLRQAPDANFEDWVIHRFGRTLYDLFFGPYTSKAWGMPCTEISADWASQRISQANLWDTILKTLNPPREGEVRSLVTQFWYPAQGGIGQIARKYAEKIRALGGEIVLGTGVDAIELSGADAARVRAGERTVECDWIASTIPLPRMLEALEPAVPDEVRTSIAELRYIAIVFVYLEVGRASVIPDHWVYLPSKDLTIHRISEFKNFSDTAAPGDRTVVCCEITCRPDDEHWKLTLEEGAEIAARDLERIGLVEAGEARGLDIAKLRYAYPVYDLAYRDNLRVLRDESKKIRNLKTTGRQGLYRYNNMDHSIAMGQKVARTILKDGAPGSEAEEIATGQEYFG